MVRLPRLLGIFGVVCGVLVVVAIWQYIGLLRPTVAPDMSLDDLDVPVPMETPNVAPPIEPAPIESSPIASPPPEPAVKPGPVAPTPASAPVHWVSGAGDPRALAQLAAAREVLACEPNHVRALEDELTALRALGRTAEAEETLARLVELQPDNRARRLEFAEALMRTGQWMRAIATLQTAIEQAPDDARAWNYLAGAQQAMGHLGDARRSWDRVVALQPDNVDAAAARGAVLLELRDWPAAEADLARAVQARPDDPTLAINYSVALVHAGREVAARECVQNILKHNPRHVPALNRLAEMAWQAYRSNPPAAGDQLAATIIWCRRSLEIDPQQPTIQKLLDNALAEQRATAP